MSCGESYDNKGLNHTVLKVDIKKNVEEGSKFSSDCEFIFVLDKSSSMNGYVNDILTRVFPKVYDKLNFKEDKKINLLTFDSYITIYIYNKNDFKNSTLSGGGSTYMSQIPTELEKILKNFDSNKTICLLTLSDGMIADQDQTQENSANLVKTLNGRFTNFNSQAIRFMSSDYAEPDTRALCSLLQLNSNLQNNNSDILLTFNPRDNNNNNVNMSDNKCEELATEIYKLFEGSKGSGWILKSKKDTKFKINPFGDNLSLLELPKGKTTLFINKICANNISKDFSLSSKDNSKKGSLLSKGEVTQSNLYQVYQDTIEKLMKKVIINKGIENSNSKNNNNEIINFIKDLEDKTPGKKESNKNLIKVFEDINNDQSANNLNGNELNDYINKKLNEFKESIDKIVKEEKSNTKKDKRKHKRIKSDDDDENYKPSKQSLCIYNLEKIQDKIKEYDNYLKEKRKREKKIKKKKMIKPKKDEPKKDEDAMIMIVPARKLSENLREIFKGTKIKCDKKMKKKKD